MAPLTSTVASTTPVAEALRTERLLLRPWNDADCDHFARWSRDPEATRYVLRGPLTDAEVAEHHRRSLAQWRELGFGPRALLAAGSRRWLGFVDISHVGPGKGCRSDDVEIGYFLLPFAWGRGLATEAAVAARDDAFARVGLLELFGRFRIENAASGRVLEKAGFTYVRRHKFPDGNVTNVTRMTLTEWRAAVGGAPGIPQNEGSTGRPSAPKRDVWL